MLLAGWVWFCYELFSARIYPQLHPPQAPVTLIRLDELNMPVAFNWGSAMPLAGKEFDNWTKQFSHLDSTGQVAVIHGGYFRDEAPDQAGLISLGRARIASILHHLEIDSNRILMEIIPQEVNADVRSNPFAAIAVDLIAEKDIVTFSGDTAQLCFPIADSLKLPPYSLDQFRRWVIERSNPTTDRAYLTGTADGTGLAESSDIAMERAEAIQIELLRQGWSKERIHLAAGQRDNPHTLLNRCVLVVIAHGE